MPWVDSSSVESDYLEVTWYPKSEWQDALLYAGSLPVQGVEYEDGQVVTGPFIDIPQESVPEPFVRVYLPKNHIDPWLANIQKTCEVHGWRLEQKVRAKRDWETIWKAYYRPIMLSNGYAVLPAWWPSSPVAPSKSLWLDPGMAFGTGGHATTRMCLNLLAEAPLDHRQVLDLGAGSGILGLFAARSGARAVTLVEPDPVAVEVLRHNLALNPDLSQVSLTEGTLKDVAPRAFDVLCMNIVWDVIRDEWDRLKDYTASGSLILLSGLLSERLEDVKALAARHDWRLLDVQEAAGWLMVAVRS